jgi:hypothetical protein
MTHRGEDLETPILIAMSAITNDDDQTYQVETKVSAGKIEDPVTGEAHKIDPYDDDRGGVIEVERPDSAKYIVDQSESHRFVSKAPTAEAVKEAEKDHFNFAGSDVCVTFAKRYGNNSLGSQPLDPSDGFDPATDPAHNGQRLKIMQAYDRLDEAGYGDEAAYLRALVSPSLQNDFIKFARKRLEVDL